MLAPMPPRVWAARPGDVMNRAVLLMLGGIALGAAALPARAEAQAQTQAQTPADCPAPTVSVQSAKKFIDTKVDPGAGQGAVKPADDIVQLGDTIELTMTGLPELLADLDCRKTKGLPRRTLVLFLAAQPIKGLAGYMAGIRLAVGRAVVAMVIAEFFTTISGLGAIIINSANNFDTATMFVPIVVLMVLAIGLNSLIGWVERTVAPWQAEIAGRDE